MIMMIGQTTIQDKFNDAILGRGDDVRHRAVLEMTRSTSLDIQAFGQIAQLLNRVLYENASPSLLVEISAKFFPVPQTRENFQILETCFYALYTHSTNPTTPERSREVLDRAIELLGFIGRNGFDISDATALAVEQRKHPVASDEQNGQLRSNLMQCKRNRPSFVTIPPLAALRLRERKPPEHHHSAGRAKA